VKTRRSRKSISKEHTFPEDVMRREDLVPILKTTRQTVEETLLGRYRDRRVRSLVVKLKFADFTQTTAERASSVVDEAVYLELLTEAWSRGNGRPVRLFGLGVRLLDEKDDPQMELF
jgi:DNA polymerase-4